MQNLLTSSFRGLNRSVPAALLSPGESPDTTDAAPYGKLVGTLGARLGRSRIYTHTAATSILGLGMLKVPFGRYRVIASDDGKWSVKGIAWPGFATPADLSDLTGMNTSARVRFLQYKDRLLAFNGRNAMRSLDGTGWTLAGIVTGSGITPGVADSGGGSGPNGSYRYFITPCNSKKLNILGRPTEGVPSNISADITVTNHTITVSSIPATHADSQVDSWNVYRSLAAGYSTGLPNNQQDFFYVGSVALATTTFSDSVTDIALVSARRLRFNQQPPAAFKYGAIANDRMFGIGFDPITTGTVTRVKTINGTVAVLTNVATISTTTAHGFTVGQSVTVAGLANSFFNGTFTIVATPTTTTFTYALVHANTGALADTGTADSPSTFIDFTTALPDGAVGTWFKKAGESTKYRITALATTRATIAGLTLAGKADVGFVGAAGSLTAASYSVYRNPWDVYCSEFQDMEAAGPDGEGLRYKEELPNEAPTAIASFQGQVLVFTATDIYEIIGSGPDFSTIGLRLLYRGIGCVSGDAVCQVDNELHFLSLRGPALIAGGEPQLYGIPLNSDWLDTMTADELVTACAGTDDERVWYSATHSTTVRTWRYERYTQTWWEETGINPAMIVRHDLVNGTLNVPLFIQGQFLVRPNYGTLDLVTAAKSGTNGLAATQTFYTTHYNREGVITNAVLTGNVATITLNATHDYIVGETIHVDASNNAYDDNAAVITAITTTTFSYAKVHADIATAAASGFTAVVKFTADDMVECYARFYNAAGQFMVARRIISNTDYSFTWSSTGVGGGLLGDGTAPNLAATGTFEIGNVGWKWQTKDFDNDDPVHQKTNQEVLLALYQKDTNATVRKQDVIDGAKQVDTNSLAIEQQVDCKSLVTKFGTGSTANFTYGAVLSSRDGAVLRGVSVDSKSGGNQI